MPAPTFAELLMQLQNAEIVPRPDNENWQAHVTRISVHGRCVEVTEEEYFYWLEVLPPRFQRGNLFAFAEGAEALRLFWQRGEQYYCRQLTEIETAAFCRLANIPIPS